MTPWFQVNDITSTIQSAINNYALICINDLKQSKKYVNLDQETQKKIEGYQYEIKKRDEILKKKGIPWGAILGGVALAILGGCNIF